MNLTIEKFQTGFKNGLQKGWQGYIWLLKILIPISFLTALLEFSGWLGKIDFLLSPVMGFLHLPASAAIPIIAGVATGIYGAVAALMVLSLTPAQMTLCAIFVLISHNLIQEGVIQGKSGLNPLKATFIRLGASVLTVWLVGWFLADPSAGQVAGPGAGPESQEPLLMMLKSWMVLTFWLCLKILVIIMSLMVVLETLKAFNAIPHIVKVLRPFMKIMGLDREVGLMWLTAVFFGLSYGAAVIVEEARENSFDAQSLERLHISIGINHAIIEDPALFLPLGISAFWLWIPRIITAVIAVQLYRFWYHLKPGVQKGYDPAVSNAQLDR